MQNRSDEYKKAIVASTRKIVAKSLIDLVSPDIVYHDATSSAEMIYSRKDQVYDRVFEPAPSSVTLELNRWKMNGSQKLYDNDSLGEQGFISDQLCKDDCIVNEVWVQLNISNLYTLQACSVFFTGSPNDGIASDFTVEVYSGQTLAWSKDVFNNKDTAVYFDGFTAYDVTAIRVIPTRWSLPGYRSRVIEIIPGLYEEWDGKTIYSVDVMQQVDFSCLSLPYGVATLSIKNNDRRFDPTNKTGLFKSVEERQAIPIQFGVETDAGVEFKSVGTFYQKTGGWSIEQGGLLMTWQLVDIVGLIANRQYQVPSTMPSTFSGWLESIVAQIGKNFADRYIVDDELGKIELTCDPDAISNVTCGTLLRWLCQACGAYPVADAETGFLSAKKVNETVTNRLALTASNDFPTISDNIDISVIIFRIGEEEFSVSGTNLASDKTVTVANPFIKTKEQALIAAKNILINYGGHKIDSYERGDMANELGDINAVEVAKQIDMAGRRYKQQFRLSDGIMSNVASSFIQATGITLYEDYDVIVESGTWTAPDGVTSVTIIIIGGGDGGEAGTDGTWFADGVAGAGGLGGKVWFNTIKINRGQIFDVHIGAGGAPGKPGEESTVGGSYSSANGQRFDGYTVLALGNVYGLNGQDGDATSGQDGTGNGGGGGPSGLCGITGWDGYTSYIKRYPTAGGPGGRGGSGAVIFCYDKGHEQ